MWSETVGLRTRPVSDQKIDLGLGLGGLMLCCETRSCHARHHNEGHSKFSSTIYRFYVLETSLLWRSTVAFTYIKIKSTKCFCLLPVVLVLLAYFFLGLGLQEFQIQEFGLVYIIDFQADKIP